VKCLTRYCDRVKKAIDVTNLFQESPVLHFRPEKRADGLDDMKVLKSRKKKVITLDIGSFDAIETVLVSPDNRVHHSLQLRKLTPQRCTYGYDILVYVGNGLFRRNCRESQLMEELARRNVPISQSEIGVLGRKFIAYLAIAHQQSHKQLRDHMALRGGYILHMDGTCEGDSPHLFTGMDGIAKIVLDNIKLPSEKAELIAPFLRQIKRQYGDPIALVHDMGAGILSAVKTVFENTPDFICHFHFLRDIGKDLLEADYTKIRTRLKKHKIRTVLRRKLKALEEAVNADPRAVAHLLHSLDRGQLEPALLESMPELTAYAMIYWALDTSDQLDGYGFPFDCQHLIFYQQLRDLHSFVTEYSLSTIPHNSANHKALLSLWRPLTRIVEDQQLTRASSHMQQKVVWFKKLREALAMAIPGEKKALNDDGLYADMSSIEEKVTAFREEVVNDEELSGKDEYEKMVKQIDKYWGKLFADPITANTPNGAVIIQPQRTNNILERFFRDLKRGHRKKTGTISLNRTIKSILSDTPLVKNIDNPEYMRILLDGCSTLEERFEKIDSKLVLDRLKSEQDKTGKLNPDMKRIIRFPDLPGRMMALMAS
jgi:hypothetical protein